MKQQKEEGQSGLSIWELTRHERGNQKRDQVRCQVCLLSASDKLVMPPLCQQKTCNASSLPVTKLSCLYSWRIRFSALAGQRGNLFFVTCTHSGCVEPHVTEGSTKTAGSRKRFCITFSLACAHQDLSTLLQVTAKVHTRDTFAGGSYAEMPARSMILWSCICSWQNGYKNTTASRRKLYCTISRSSCASFCCLFCGMRTCRGSCLREFVHVWMLVFDFVWMVLQVFDFF